MDETTRVTRKRKTGSSNTNTSDHESGLGAGTEITEGKSIEENSKKSLVDQGTPNDIVINIETDNKEDKKVVPKRKPVVRKKKVTLKEKSDLEKVKDIQNLLEGVFMVASLRGGEHWVLTPDESKQIAGPLSRILDRYDMLSKVTEVSDPVALIVASATIVMPRLMISKMSMDEKKKEILNKNGAITHGQKRNNPTVSRSDVSATETTNTLDDGQSLKSIYSEVQSGF